MDKLAKLTAMLDEVNGQINGLQNSQSSIAKTQTPQQFAAVREAELYQEYMRTNEGEAAHMELKVKFEDWCARKIGRMPASEISQKIAQQQEEIEKQKKEIERLAAGLEKMQKDLS